MNHLYYGDNLHVLRDHVADASVDLVYLDPPFNSNADYNTILRTPSGKAVPAQEDAFKDTWQWDDAVSGVAVSEVKRNADHQAAGMMLDAMVGFLGRNALTAYLAMMAVRLIELHRVLKPTGSLYLHCDPTASHYLKVLLDAVFGARNFRNEIVWKRSSAHSGSKKFAPVHDTILFYSKAENFTWNPAFQPIPQETADAWYNNIEPGTGRRFNRDNLTASGRRTGSSGQSWRGVDVSAKNRHWAIPGFMNLGKMNTQEALDLLDAQGRLFWPKKADGVPMFKRYLDESPGVPALDVFTDIQPLNNVAKERLGYPTQKPVALLERIIAASSNPGDLVLDPFCGCGTTVHAAQKLGRAWIGIDVTHVAVGLIETRLRSAFPGIDFQVHGTPMDLDAARDFFARNDSTKKEFEKWAVTRLGFLPQTKKGADGGFDGMVWFGPKEDRRAIVSVKGGKSVTVETVRSLDAVVKAQGADVGVLLSLEEPTSAARDWARQGGLCELPGFRSVPRLQVVTVAEALALRERAVDLPTRAAPVRSAPKEQASPAARDLFS